MKKKPLHRYSFIKIAHTSTSENWMVSECSILRYYKVLVGVIFASCSIILSPEGLILVFET